MKDAILKVIRDFFKTMYKLTIEDLVGKVLDAIWNFFWPLPPPEEAN